MSAIPSQDPSTMPPWMGVDVLPASHRRSGWTVGQIIEPKRRTLRNRQLHLLIPALDDLEQSLGADTELSDRSARFLAWFLIWDSDTYEGLTALITDIIGTTTRP